MVDVSKAGRRDLGFVKCDITSRSADGKNFFTADCGKRDCASDSETVCCSVQDLVFYFCETEIVAPYFGL